MNVAQNKFDLKLDQVFSTPCLRIWMSDCEKTRPVNHERLLAKKPVQSKAELTKKMLKAEVRQ